MCMSLSKKCILQFSTMQHVMCIVLLELSVVCRLSQSLQVTQLLCLSFLFGQAMNNTPTEMKKAQVIHKCGDDESEGLFHVIRMCCLGWDSQLDLSCVSNGEGSQDTVGGS
jgi:hypothetical protein